MKVAFLIEYFPPYAIGGSEWSTYYLAQQLSKQNIDVVVITPDYGNKKLNEKVDFKIVKFPFYKKIQNSSLPGNFFYTNPLWIIWTALAFLYFVQRERVDVIHVQGKYSLPGARLANLFLRKPIIVTLRDYQPLCNYGFCLYHKNKACNLKHYFTHDFKTYYKEYVLNKSEFKLVLNILFAVWGRLAKTMLAISAKGTHIVVLSKYQKEVYEANGFLNTEVIGNSIVLPKHATISRDNTILYIGRLTPGKGIELLISALPRIAKMLPNYQFLFIGEGFLKEKLQVLSKKNSRIKLLGQVGHEGAIQALRKAKLTIIPSVWPEPFGRVAAESLMCKTPLVVTNRGALPELVNKRWGVISDATPEAFCMAVKKGIDKNDDYKKNIQSDYTELKKSFTNSTPDKYQKLYKEITG